MTSWPSAIRDSTNTRTSAAAWVAGLTQMMPGDLGMRVASQQVSEPPIDRPGDDDLLAARGEALVGGLGVGGPVGPVGVQHVLDLGAVPGQQRHLDAVARGGERLGQRPHGLRVAGEAVQHQHADRPAVDRHGLGPVHDLAHPGSSLRRPGHARAVAIRVARAPMARPALRCAGPVPAARAEPITGGSRWRSTCS